MHPSNPTHNTHIAAHLRTHEQLRSGQSLFEFDSDFFCPGCWPKPRNCAELYRSGVHTDGVYQIYPLLEDQPTAVFCDMTTDGGGWTVNMIPHLLILDFLDLCIFHYLSGIGHQRLLSNGHVFGLGFPVFFHFNLLSLS